MIVITSFTFTQVHELLTQYKNKVMCVNLAGVHGVLV